MVLTLSAIKHRLKQLQISPDKWLGQHFLIAPAIYDQIMVTGKRFLTPNDTILEVGPGLGNLTDELLKQQLPVIAIEKDPIFSKQLSSFLEHPTNLAVIQGDVLKQLAVHDDLKELDSWCVVANIPYAISSPLIRSLLYRANPPHDILVLVQKEMAERIVAPPGDTRRGVLTVECETMAQAKIIQAVPKTAFWPEPKVESALLHLSLRDQPLIPDAERSQVIKTFRAGFSVKRKQLANSLSGSLQREKREVAEVLQQIDIDPKRRAETLSVEEWRRLTTALTRGV